MEHHQLGDYVKITNSGKTYDTFEKWAQKHIHPPLRWVPKKLPTQGDIYEITAIEKTSSGAEYSERYAVSDKEGNTFIVGATGFVNVNTLFKLQTLIEELDMYLDFDEPLAPGEAIRVRDTEKVNILFRKLKEAITKP